MNDTLTTGHRTPIRVFYIPAKGKAGIREIANDLASLLALASEGTLDVIDLESNLSLFCDDCRTERAFAYNFSVGVEHVHGDAFVVRRRGMQLVSLDDADVSRLMASPMLRKAERASRA